MQDPKPTRDVAARSAIRWADDELLDHIDIPIYALDGDRRLIRMNHAAERLFGYTEAETLGQRMHELVHSRRPDGSPYPIEECSLQLASEGSGKARDIPEVMWSRSGEAIPLECSVEPIELDSGRVGSVVTLKDLRLRQQAEDRLQDVMREQRELLRQRDATARVERELHAAEVIRKRDLSIRLEQVAAQQLREQQELLAATARNAPIGIAILDHDLNIRWWNPTYQSYLNPAMQSRSLAGVPVLEAVNATGEDAGRVLRHVRDTGEPFTTELFAFDGMDRGRTFWRWSLTRLESGDLVMICSDVTEQKKAQDALVQSDKMAAVGRLAASISHEINNPLEAVTNLLYLLAHDPGLSPESREYVAAAESELARVSQIASQTLRFHRQAVGATPVTAQQLVEPVVALYQGRLKHTGITVEREYRDTAQVVSHEGDIRQVLNNLLGNAIEAIGQGRERSATIRIRTHAARCARTGMPGLRITIADTGSGMSRETAARIFEPFFTTKGASGSGLGLWISHTIVTRHGGALQVRSKRRTPADESIKASRAGTTFSVFLPDQGGTATIN